MTEVLKSLIAVFGKQMSALLLQKQFKFYNAVEQ